MNTKHNIIKQIQDRLGSEGTRELAERVYRELSDIGNIYWGNYYGFVMRNSVDVLGAAVVAACLGAVAGFVWYVKAILDMVA